MVDITGKDGKTFSFHVAAPLKKFLDEKVIKRINTRDKDYVMMLSGYEGSGKSTFASQLAKYVDHDFGLDRMCFTAEEFKQAVYGAKKGQAIVYDEAVTGMTAGGSITKVGKLLKSMMMQMRQKNLFVIIVIPSVFELNKYAVLHRAMCLFHVYEKKGIYAWVGYNKKATKMVYILGKKTNTIKVRSRFNGRFYGNMGLDKAPYEKKKEEALIAEGEEDEKVSKYSVQRDFFIWELKRHLKTAKAIYESQKSSKMPLSYAQVARIVSKESEN